MKNKLHNILKQTRKEPGLSLKEISQTIKDVFSQTEIEALAKEITPNQPKQPKMVEITRSFSFKLSLPNYQNADFFCSQKKECFENEIEEVSEELYKFCRNQVIKSVNEYKKLIGLNKSIKVSYKTKDEADKKLEAVESELAEQKLKEPQKNREA